MIQKITDKKRKKKRQGGTFAYLSRMQPPRLFETLRARREPTRQPRNLLIGVQGCSPSGLCPILFRAKEVMQSAQKKSKRLPRKGWGPPHTPEGTSCFLGEGAPTGCNLDCGPAPAPRATRPIFCASPPRAAPPSRTHQEHRVGMERTILGSRLIPIWRHTTAEALLFRPPRMLSCGTSRPA